MKNSYSKTTGLNSEMKKIIAFFVIASFYIPVVSAQYCNPTHSFQFLEPIINGISLGTINNQNTTLPLMSTGYSDYTSMSTNLIAAATYNLTVTSGAGFPYNYAAWIDYNHDNEFSTNEKIGSTIVLLNYATGIISFTVPASAYNGSTRLRVRATIEPSGPWMLSTDPCTPWHDGEAEDYSVNISGGCDNNISIIELSSPVSGVALGIENLSIRIANYGNTNASNFSVNYSINAAPAVIEFYSGTLQPDSVLQFTFSASYDFSTIACYNIVAWIIWINDQSGSDDTISLTICHTMPVIGNGIWYLHSNVNGNLEPLGGPPYYSTTNKTCMDSVFGVGNWTQAYLETVNPDSLFSSDNCFIFIDGSHEGSHAFQIFVNQNRLKMENWVASGGNLFLNYIVNINCIPCDLILDLGFKETKACGGFQKTHGLPFDSLHPVFSGPFLPVIDQWSGFFTLNVLYGDDLAKLIAENDHEWAPDPVLYLPLLAEKQWGNGKVIFGTLFPSQLVNPPATAMHSRMNTIAYLHNCSLPTFIDEFKKDRSGSITVYPNPACDRLYVQLNSIRFFNLTLYDFKSNILLQQNGNSNGINDQLILNISQLAKGIYFLKWQTESNTGVEKIVIQ